jgi:hypothetical protein
MASDSTARLTCWLRREADRARRVGLLRNGKIGDDRAW